MELINYFLWQHRSSRQGEDWYSSDSSLRSKTSFCTRSSAGRRLTFTHFELGRPPALSQFRKATDIEPSHPQKPQQYRALHPGSSMMTAGKTTFAGAVHASVFQDVVEPLCLYALLHRQKDFRLPRAHFMPQMSMTTITRQIPPLESASVGSSLESSSKQLRRSVSS